MRLQRLFSEAICLKGTSQVLSASISLVAIWVLAAGLCILSNVKSLPYKLLLITIQL